MLVLQTSVKHVFEGNFQCAIESMNAVTREDLSKASSTSLTSDYVRIYGDFSAILCLQMPREMIGHIAQVSLGLDVFKEETFAGDQILRDASGEIVNMIAGTFKNMLSRVKLNCRLLPPQRFNDEAELVSRTMHAKNHWLLNLKVGGSLMQIILLSVRE